MKALSIKQPWASLIAHGIKDIENRTWKTKFRGRIYIHASANWDERSKGNDASKLLTTIQYNSIPHQVHGLFLDQGIIVKDSEIPISAIIGEVDIVDCVINHPSIWAEQSEFCPITGLRFFMEIENENGLMVRTYGGPFDSYTIPEPDETCKGEYVRERFCHDSNLWQGSENISKLKEIPKDRKPIYNWVLANPILYSKPILNIKGKLSFWLPEENQTCTDCQKKYFGPDAQYCCKQRDCGCMGLPIEPMLCDACCEKRFNKSLEV